MWSSGPTQDILPTSEKNAKVYFFPGCYWGKYLHTGLPLATHWEWHSLQNQFRFVVKYIFTLKSYQEMYMQITETSRRALRRCSDKKEAKCLYGNGLCLKQFSEDLMVLWVGPFKASHKATET